ncbi:oxygen-independent coproporphyrinogen III oxidase [Aliifodinibius sp. S!AR15-10]|uniref:oxygen-independent coproporphyrinogen III oxidase n=1 Tax=Aliifodinibius sp. S!AR15-10 TaxID=2950437 RepID=UPI0028600DB8|nr:oxygen-independent coproporphyrinogen III oxidase [Aliifodinibius sp. S!AR15-10]MDR8393176.1 oxygen-independent coproporphyrinogen III oxidase [Aliifodinibius sp. S!AR15-10]
MDASGLNLDLIKKYNVQGPRYTSYPTAPQFKEVGEEAVLDLKKCIFKRNQEAHQISLYFHIPFCFSLCWYCGCTKVITKDQDRGDIYLDYLENEMDQVKELLHPDSKVVQIHFGGGTPTFLAPDQLTRLGSAIHQRFNTNSKTEFSIEIDPWRCTREHIRVLKSIGCNRASLGVQDTNPNVQKAIHRIQPYEQTKLVTDWLREEEIRSINFDLIYGLPRQTLATFQQTMNDVLQLKPDRLAVYSYAHIPQIMPAQRLLNVNEMPTTDEKLSMLLEAIAHFTGNGFRFIGMDHFSRRDEELSQAIDNDSLQRNFQGYSTLAGADLYGFGMSAISNVGNRYWQNSKEMNEYYRLLGKSTLPVKRLLHLCKDDLVRKDAIMRIMCRKSLSKSEMEEKWGIDFETYFGDALQNLVELERDGLVSINRNEIVITEKGRLFLRNIAICFDRYLNRGKTDRNFSKTV